MPPTNPQNLVIKLALDNVSQVIGGINAITQAWAQQNTKITKNMLQQQSLMNDSIRIMGNVANAAQISSNKFSLAIQRSSDNTKQLITILGDLATQMITSGKPLTKNKLEMLEVIRRVIQGEEQTAQTAITSGNAINKQTKQNTNTVSDWEKALTGVANAIDKVSAMVGKLAGSFAVLGKAGSSIGGGLGTLIGGPTGGLLGGAIGSLGGNILGAIINIPFMIIKSFGKMFDFIISGFVKVGKSIWNFFFGPLSLVGLAVGNLFKGMFTGVTQFADSVFDAAAAFQQLEISMETLTRRNIATDLGIDIISVSAAQASEETEKLFDWLKKVSLTSPFTMQSIAEAMKFASAMGLSTKMTEDLTIATGNFAAAMGLTDDHQYRIMYNLAQIYQQGKLTGREFRDLAISFVPVYDILGVMAKEAGMSTEAFKKLALEGGVPVQDFFKHFIDYMQTNFPDAMEKMAKTMEGVKNNIKDFVQVVLGMEVLGPVTNRVSEALAKVLDKLLNPRTHNIAKDFGEGLARAFDVVREAVNKLGGAISALFATIGFHMPTLEDFEYAWVKIYVTVKHGIGLITTIVQTINDAVVKYIVPIIKTLGGAQGASGGWGINLIKNFAEGMIRGAAKFLATAIAYIAAIIKGFFAPGSPPKVAPQIDTWGAQMINEWIGGAVNGADWNVLGAGVAQNVAQQMGVAQNPPIGWQEPQMGTLDTGPEGTATEDYVNSIQTTVSNAVTAVSNFVTEQGMRLAAYLMHGFTEEMFDALDAIQGPVKSAIDALSGLGLLDSAAGLEMFYDISMDTISALDQFNKTGEISAHLIEEISNLGMGLGPELATLVMDEFNLAKAVKDAAAAQERLNAAITALGNARANVHNLVRDYNSLIRAGTDKRVLKGKLQQINLAEQAVTQAENEKLAAEANKKAADDNVTKMKELVSLQTKLIENMIELMNIQKESMSGAGSGIEDITAAVGDLGDTLDEISENWTPFNWINAEGEVEPGIQAFFDNLGDIFKTTFEDTMTNLDTSGAATNFVNGIKQGIMDALGMEPLEDVWVRSAGHAKDHAVRVAGPSFFQQVVEKLFSGTVDWGTVVTKVTNTLVGIMNKGVDKTVAALKDPTNPIHILVVDGAIKLSAAFISAFWGAVWDNIWSGASEEMQNRAESNPYTLQWLIDQFTKGQPDSEIPIPVKIDPVVTPLATPTTTSIPFTFTPIMEPISQDTLSTLSTNGEQLGTSMAQGTESGWTTEIDTFVANIWPWIKSHIVDPFLKSIGAGSPATEFEPIGTSMAEGIVKGFEDMINSVIGPNGAIVTAVNNIINAIKTALGITGDGTESSIFVSMGNAITNGLASGIEAMDTAIQDAIAWLVSYLPDWAKKLLGIASPSKVMKKIGEQAVEGMIVGIEDSGKQLESVMKKVYGVVPPPITANKAYYAPSATKPLGSVASKVNNVTFGDVYLNNNMDYETFKAMVNKVIVGP